MDIKEFRVVLNKRYISSLKRKHHLQEKSTAFEHKKKSTYVYVK